MSPNNHTRAGVIDIGTNSIKLIIGESTGDELVILESLKNVVPFGAYTFYKGRISQEATNQTISILEKYKRVLKECDVKKIRTIATTAVREAKNREIFVDTVLRKTGLKIDVLNASDVVFYLDRYLSRKLQSRYPIQDKNVLVAELGSGSLDVSLVEKNSPLMNVGLPIGTMRMKQLMAKLDGSLSEIQEAIEDSIEKEFFYLKRMIPQERFDDIILIDEAYSFYIQNLLPTKSSGADFFELSVGESEKILSRLMDRSPEDIASEFDIPIEIAETFYEYAVVLKSLFGLAPSSRIYILETSLSEAILASTLLSFELSKNSNRMGQLLKMASFLCERYRVDIEYIRHVANLSKVLFNKLRSHVGLEKNDLTYLMLAAYLRDLGMFIHNRAHHKHTEYIVSSLNFFGLTDEEMKIVACVARYHRKAPPMARHLLYASLPSKKQILVQKLSSLLRIANSLERTRKRKVKKLSVEISDDHDITLKVKTNSSYALERAGFQEKKQLFEEITGSRISLVIENEG